MTVPANHVTAVIGPSGCGKSTFVRCLNRMHETIPEARAEGSVKVGEMDVYGDGSDPVEVRRRIGMVFQKPNPFPTMSIYGNVAAGLKLNGFRHRKQMDELVERSLKLAALWDEVKDNLHKKSGASLSGGQQQRLVHRARAGGGARSSAYGRAGVSSRSDFHQQDRRTDFSIEAALHRRDCYS